MSRVEIITGRGERRRWSAEEKARLVAETYEPGAIITHVARRHGVAESCLHLWRKQLGGNCSRGWQRWRSGDGESTIDEVADGVPGGLAVQA